MRHPRIPHVLVLAAFLLFPLGSSRAAFENPVLRLALEAEPSTLDWNHYRGNTERFIISFLMRGMLKYDSAAQPVCDLCKSFRVSTDGRTYLFELDPKATWSDGVKLEAQHFVDSFQRFLNPASATQVADDFKLIEGARPTGKKWDPTKLAVQALGKAQLQIVLSEPLPLFPHLLTTIAAFPIRKELFQKTRQDNGEVHASTAVLGPYQLAAWEKGKRVVIEGNPKYQGSRPVYRVEFILGEHADQLAKFKAGRIDILSNPTTEDLLKLPDQKIEVNAYWATRNMVFNLARAPLSHLALRKAVLYALDRETLPAFLKNGERKVTGLIPPGLSGYRDLPLVTPNPTLAQTERHRALPGENWEELKLLTRDSETDRKVAKWLSERLEKIKIRLRVEAKSAKAYFLDLDRANFDLALQVWSFDIASPLELLRTFQTGASLNWARWTNVAYDGQVNELLHDRNPSGSPLLLDQVTQLLETQEVPLIPLGYPTQPFLLGPRVNSFATTPFGDPNLVKIELKH